jgi:hypothetical protein
MPPKKVLERDEEEKAYKAIIHKFGFIKANSEGYIYKDAKERLVRPAGFNWWKDNKTKLNEATENWVDNTNLIDAKNYEPPRVSEAGDSRRLPGSSRMSRLSEVGSVSGRPSSGAIGRPSSGAGGRPDLLIYPFPDISPSSGPGQIVGKYKDRIKTILRNFENQKGTNFVGAQSNAMELINAELFKLNADHKKLGEKTFNSVKDTLLKYDNFIKSKDREASADKRDFADRFASNETFGAPIPEEDSDPFAVFKARIDSNVMNRRSTLANERTGRASRASVFGLGNITKQRIKEIHQ